MENKKDQAVLILAHTNIDQVIQLATNLSEFFKVIIHIDKKVQLKESQIKSLKELEKKQVSYFSKLDVKWGSFSIVSATIELYKIAMKDSTIKYVHVISGQDWQALNLGKIVKFYENNDSIYLENMIAENIYKSGEKISNWQKFYFNYDKINRKSLFGKIYHRVSYCLQVVFRVNKFKKYNLKVKLYTGSQWCDLPRYAVEYLLDYVKKNPTMMHIFETSFCSDEFWMQTILCNSKFKSKILNNNHRFIKWEKKYNSYPAILDQSDYKSVSESGAHFMRKIDLNISKGLLNNLKNN